jgi:dsRNA-specific ribonuclease
MFASVDKNPVQSYKTMAQEYTQKKYKQIPEYIDSEYKSDGR